MTLASKENQSKENEMATEGDGSTVKDKKTVKSGKLRAPENIIAIMRKLERRAKKKELERSLVLQQMTEFGMEVGSEHFNDILIKCISCEDGTCQAANVKCLLCLERVPNSEFLQHLQTDHPFFKHKVCWVSCAYKVTPIIMGDKRDRIIAKKLLVSNKSCDTKEHDSSKIEIFKCSLCEICVETMSELRYHMKSCHEISSVYPCKVCWDVFKNPGNKREHAHYCEGGSPLKCDLCHALLDSFKALWSHMKQKHELQTKSFAKEDYPKDVTENNEEIHEKNDATEKERSGSNESVTEGDGIITRCISCRDRCNKDLVSCMLCATNVSRQNFTQHVTEFHRHSPTNVYWYRCKFVYRRQSKLFGGTGYSGRMEERVVGKFVNLMCSYRTAL